MMVLYSGTTDPYSHRCRFVLFEKGMDRDPRRRSLAKPEHALIHPSTMCRSRRARSHPYDSHILKRYIDERSRIAVMPATRSRGARGGSPLNSRRSCSSTSTSMRARTTKCTDRSSRRRSRRSATADPAVTDLPQNNYMLGDDFRFSTWPSRPCSGAWTTMGSTCRRTPCRCSSTQSASFPGRRTSRR